MQTFLRDKPSQLAIGLFVATFAHSMVAMREVQFEGEGQVPGIAVAVGYLLVLTSIAMLVLYVDHIGRSLRVSALIELVGTDTRQLLDQQYPNFVVLDEDEDLDVVAAPKSGVLVSIDRERLVRLAADADCVVHVVPALGSFVPSGAALIRIEGDGARLDRDAAAAALASGLERTLDQDIAYGFRMLVDMAERALSDSPFLDPTTAVQALDPSTTDCGSWWCEIFPMGAGMTRTGSCDSPFRSWTGRPTCTSRSTRFGSRARRHRRSVDGSRRR